jgi:hypothetical protein
MARAAESMRRRSGANNIADADFSDDSKSSAGHAR